MQFLQLLGKQLRDDYVIAVLESFEMEVVYDFDRLHEGQPDKYWASSKQGGFQLRFDANQTVDACFLYIVPSDGFAALSERNLDISLFTTAAEVESFGNSLGLQVSKGKAEFLGVTSDWVRLVFAAHSVHYEYRGGHLALVTVTREQQRLV